MAVGVDIEDVSRFVNKSQAFIDRIFTQNEQKYCLSKKDSYRHFAARFCAKEAVIKALSSMGLEHPKLKDIEIYNNEKGCPFIKLPENFKNLKIDLSISHDKTKAIAFVIVNKI